jgi:hypothetical protein
MKRIGKARIAKALVGYAAVVVAVVGLRSAQVHGLNVGLGPSPALRNYQNRIQATRVLLETGRLDVSGN